MKTFVASHPNTLVVPSQRVTPILTVPDPQAALDFYRQAFDAVEIVRLTNQSGLVVHAEVEISGARIVLANGDNSYGVIPDTLHGSTVLLHIYVPDVDQSVAQATASGATQLAPITDKFYGERSAVLRDPFGHIWSMATLQQVLAVEEVQQRWAALTGQPTPCGPTNRSSSPY